MDEEKNNEQVKENVPQKPKKNIKKTLIFAGITFMVIIFILGFIVLLFGDKSQSSKEYTIPDVYNFTGKVVYQTKVSLGLFNDATLAIEENDTETGKQLKLVVLKDNKDVSSCILFEGDMSRISKNFAPAFDDYNADASADFAYLSEKNENGNKYKIYTINQAGEISVIGETDFIASNNLSVGLLKNGDKYEKKDIKVYYDGYLVGSDVGEYMLVNKASSVPNTISKTSKIAISEKYNAIPRIPKVTDKITQNVLNINSWINDFETSKMMTVDLDNNNSKEFIIETSKENSSRITLLDSLGNTLAILMSSTDKLSLGSNIEVVDIDNDGIMEMILVYTNENKIKICKFNNGFLYKD